MAKAQFDIKNIDLTVATKPLYAGVGVADLAIEAVRDYAVEVQKKVADVRGDLKGFDLKDVKARRAAFEARVTELQTEAKAFPTKAQQTAQKYFDENVTAVTDTYGDLVVRGEGLVKRIRNQESTKATVKSAKTTTAKAKTTKTQTTKATKSTAKKAAPAKSSAKATGTAAKKTATSAAKATTDGASKVGD